MMREYNHVKGYRMEKIFVYSFVAFFFFILNWYVVRPILNLMVNVNSFQCDESDKWLIAILGYLSRLAMPLAPQIVFVFLLWQAQSIIAQGDMDDDDEEECGECIIPD
jgi:hypothetical protein